MLGLEIRQEQPEENGVVEQLVKESFSDESFKDYKGYSFVRRLHQSATFNPELSLVAVLENQSIGYILFSEITIGKTTCLALAPLAVLPPYQNQKIGGELIKEGHRIASMSGYPVSVVMGHAEYYPRFGYIPTFEFGIEAPFDVLPEDFLAVELIPDTIQHISGVVQYAPEFFKSIA